MGKIQVTRRHKFEGHSSGIFALQSVGEFEFLSGGGDGQVVLWNLKNLDEGRVIAKVGSTIYGMLVDAGRLIVGENGRAIHLIDLDTKEVIRSIEIKAPVFAIHRANDRYFVGTGAGELFVFDLSLNYLNKLRPCTKSVRSIKSFETDLALGLSDNTIRIFDKETLEQKYEVTGHTLSVFSLVFNSDKQQLLSVGRDAQIRVWDVFNHYKEIKSIPAHMYAANDIVLDPSGKWFATGSMDKTIKIWDTSTLALLKVIDKARHEGHMNSVNKLLWMGIDNLLVTCSDDRTIGVWDIKTD